MSRGLPRTLTADRQRDREREIERESGREPEALATELVRSRELIAELSADLHEREAALARLQALNAAIADCLEPHGLRPEVVQVSAGKGAEFWLCMARVVTFAKEQP
jgi:hypothetical protein